MPDLFFAWAGRKDRWVHYEFLDNSVPKGERPRTIAYGQNGSLVVNDLEKLCDIERFRHVNVDATRAEDVLAKTLETHAAMAILRRAFADLDRVDVLVPGSGLRLATSENGKVRVDTGALPEGLSASDFGPHEDAEDLGQHAPSDAADVIGA